MTTIELIRRMLWTLGVWLSFSAAGHADWQYTQWGMSVEQVRSASAEKAVEDTHRGHDTKTDTALLKAPFTSGRFVFTAVFLFDNASRRLSRVNLEMDDPSTCDDLLGSLRGKYGKPDTEDMGRVFSLVTWRDAKNNNGIGWTRIGAENCTLQYHPLISDDSQKL